MSRPLCDPLAPQPRFDQISTQLHLLRCPNGLVLRYRKAIRQYLGALLRDEHDADDVAQSLVQDMLQGKFTRWDSARGRFRDYLKKAVRNAALAFLRKKKRHPDATLHEASRCSHETPEAVWAVGWRNALLEAALNALRDYQEKHPGNVFYTVLRLRILGPREHSEQLAARLAAQTGRPFTADNVRKQFERARRLFAGLLLREVKSLMPDSGPEQIQEELLDLGLSAYLRDFLPHV
jgi:hypothetical protein